MVFAGVPFLFYFLPALLAAYVAVPKTARRTRNRVLLGASLLFYAWGEGGYLLLLIASIALNHGAAHFVAQRRSRTALIIGIAGNLALLGFYKYAGFLGAQLGVDTEWAPRLPLGVSFFTFQAISYLVDIHRREAPPARSLEDTALYIALFPQLIAGPIVRFQTIAGEIFERDESRAHFAAGVRLFVLGLSQKVLIANLAAGPADAIFALPTDERTLPIAWAGIGAYTLQIFFDFAGYSNMAMGLGRMFGFGFPRNFAYPYASRSITEFWRRWHMTLSRWFRDYLYIPLGGNRLGQWVTIRNLWIVFLLCGLWHGAAWTFVLWGAWHGAFLSLERAGLRAPGVLGHVYLIVTVMLSWVLFRAENLGAAGSYYATLFGSAGLSPAELPAYFPGLTFFWLVMLVILATPIPERVVTSLSRRLPTWVSGPLEVGGLAMLFVVCAAFLVGGAYNPFIYFRF